MNAPAKPKRHLKNYLLDKKFQLTYALIMVAIALLLTSLLGYLMFRQVSESTELQEKQANENISIFKTQSGETLKVFKEASDKTESVFTSQSGETKTIFKNKTKVATEILQLMMTVEDLKAMAEENLKKMKQDDAKAIKEMEKKIAANKESLKKEINKGITQKEKQLKQALGKLQSDKAKASKVRKSNNQRIFIGVIIFSAIFIIIIFLYTIVLTHKVAGPLFKVTLYLKKMENATYGPIWPLRKGDQLQDFYEKFSNAYKAVAGRIKVDVAEMDEILSEMEKHCPEEVVARMKALRDRKADSVKTY
ncbi:MAG: hypothetical protein JXR95_04530 [Deltaproteobacteria bacterium]|nr:hypothetical protein [Deltaproteobacteria bacterium]